MNIKNKIATGIILSGFLFTAACVNVESVEPASNETNNALAGAVIGGILGSAVSSSRDARRGAVIGAAIGAGLGAAHGRTLDAQEAQLRGTLNGSGIEIQNTGQSLVLTMPQDVLFTVNSSTVLPAMQNNLNAVANSLRTYKNTTVVVSGHTDNSGSASFNQQLSERRAHAVAGILLRNNIPPQRIDVRGFGEDNPRATNLTSEGRALNRRVELIIVPQG